MFLSALQKHKGEKSEANKSERTEQSNFNDDNAIMRLFHQLQYNSPPGLLARLEAEDKDSDKFLD